MENKSGITPTLAISCEDFEKIKNSIEEKDKEIERLNNKVEELENEPLTNKISRIDSVVANIYRENKRLKEENEFLKQLIPNEKKYSYGIRMGSDKE